MPKGQKHRFTLSEDKKAKQIAKSYKKKGFTAKRAKSIGYATIQKIKKLRNR